ncbi:uncharacterized protein LOC107676296 isoform X2 [Sinocyclocheilus anshuiensis]|uniref:uncharacterized protein LOC107676296 isoform X2 n=1 Tax=Sinocyclocheilus anshuiensis TaxID=1608454 RepID=UPI0007BA8583|nr:PREDICTED: uncharacterized protein LOC107676296 isoform X2 [Sinocyclocheilus anshuiensis]
MHHHQSDSDSSDDSMKDPPFMKCESDITHLREELNRLHEKISPECNEHIKKMTEVVNEFEKDFRHATNISRGAMISGGVGVAGIILGLALAAFTGGASTIVSGLGTAALAGGGIALAIGEFKKTQQEKNLRQTIEKELEDFQKKISPIINMLEKIFNRTQEILRDPTLSKHKANAIRERFSYSFEKIHLFQRDSSREVGARKHLTGDPSEIVAEMSSVLEILEEIIEDKEEQDDNPEETPAHKQINEKEFKKKAKKFIDEMRKGINQLQNVMNEIDLTKQRLLKK